MSSATDRVLLLASLPALDPPHFLAPLLTAAAAASRQLLTVVLFSSIFNHPAAGGVNRVATWPAILRLLTFVYVQATSVAQAKGNILLKVGVLLHGNDQDLPSSIAHGVDLIFRVAGDSISVHLPISLSAIRQSFLPPANLDPNGHSSPPIVSSLATPNISPYIPIVALGGTFDYLHAGHKILLSMAAWITSRKLVIGLTDDSLLKNKKYPSLVQSFADRASAIREFLSFFRPGIICDIAPLHDVCGPTGWDTNIQGVVVSYETLSGADAIAAHRSAHGLPPLQPFVIDVISHSDVSLDPVDMELMRKTKMSSTFIREWIFEKQKEQAAENQRDNQ